MLLFADVVHVALHESPTLPCVSTEHTEVPLLVLVGSHITIPAEDFTQSSLVVQGEPMGVEPVHTCWQADIVAVLFEQVEYVACISAKQSPAACGSYTQGAGQISVVAWARKFASQTDALNANPLEPQQAWYPLQKALIRPFVAWLCGTAAAWLGELLPLQAAINVNSSIQEVALISCPIISPAELE